MGSKPLCITVNKKIMIENRIKIEIHVLFLRLHIYVFREKHEKYVDLLISPMDFVPLIRFCVGFV